MKRIIALLLLLILPFLLSSCASFSLEPEDLLAVPRSSGSESEVVSLISSNVTRSYELIYPLSGKNRGAVTVERIDDNGRRVAVALFRDKKDAASSAILFAEEKDGRFFYLGASFIPTTVIDRVDFEDIDGDTVKEILIGYQGASSYFRSIALYELEDGIDITDIPSVYNDIAYGDFDDDGALEAVCIRKSFSQEIASAVLMSYHPDKGLSPISSCEIDSDIDEIVCLETGMISEDDFGAVLDIRTSSGEYSSQILCYDERQNLLLNPLFIYGKYPDTKRAEKLFSYDVDTDGILEIPLCSWMDYSEKEEQSEVCRQVSWASFDVASMSLVVKRTAILSKDGVYSLTISNEQKDNITARYDDDNRTMRVYIWDNEREELIKNRELLYIKAYSKETYNQDRIIEAKICEFSSDIYAYLIKETDTPFSFSDQEVEKGFELL